MKIEIHLEENEKGTPIEVASAIIDVYMGNVTDSEAFEVARSVLSEIAEHIQVYLKYCEGRC